MTWRGGSLNQRLSWLAPLIGVAAILILGCQTTPAGDEANQNSSMVAATVTVRPGEPAALTATPAISSTSHSENEPFTLTFWTVEPVSPKAEGELGDFISTILQSFEQNHPEIKVNLLLKKASGKGSVLDFLRTAREVAPSILPDVAILNATELGQAYNDGLIQTLDNRLNRPIVQDLLPAARRMGTVNNRLVGVPVGLEMEHTLYNTRVFAAAPLLWSDVLSRNTKYLFPAKGVNGLVNDATLSQYFSDGGTFRNDQGEIKINEQALQNVLDFYRQALELGVIDTAILDAATTEDLWSNYLNGKANITQVSVRQYLTNRELPDDSAFSPLPVRIPRNSPVAITHGWALVLVTADVNRQRAALRLIDWFLSTSNNATWNSLNKSIPTRDTAYKQIAGDDPYWAFLTEQLNNAQPQPGFNGYDQISRVIQQAVEQVIRGEATPAEATTTAVDTLGP
jgi:ABC-type glycerol-3-phosphate transport system substrate-binding protein